MGNAKSMLRKHSSLSEDEINAINKETGFRRLQIIRLHNRFRELDKNDKGYLDKDAFANIAELSVNPLGSRIIDAFFRESKNSGQLTFREFIRVMAHFIPVDNSRPNPLSSREQKLRFAFAMYDLTDSGVISRQEFELILSLMIGTSVPVKELDEITDRIMKEAHVKKADEISFEEFIRAMEGIDVEQVMSIRFLP